MATLHRSDNYKIAVAALKILLLAGSFSVCCQQICAIEIWARHTVSIETYVTEEAGFFKDMWLALCLKSGWSEPICVKIDMTLTLTCACMHAGGASAWN